MIMCEFHYFITASGSDVLEYLGSSQFSPPVNQTYPEGAQLCMRSTFFKAILRQNVIFKEVNSLSLDRKSKH